MILGPFVGKDHRVAAGYRGHCRYIGLLRMVDDPSIRIRVKGLAKRFGEKEILTDIDLDVPGGQSTAIIGPAASGKSVLMKCLVGLYRPERGAIIFDNEDLNRMTAKRRDEAIFDFGILFQQGGLFASLPIWENVAFKLINYLKQPRTRARDVAIEKLARVGLPESVADLYPSEISGGMQKRVGLARAMTGDPSFLFLDSPTAGLDPVTSNRINAMISETVSQLSATIVCITSDMEAAQTRYDNLIMLNEGSIVWRGSTADVAESEDAYLQQMICGQAAGPIKMPVLAVE